MRTIPIEEFLSALKEGHAQRLSDYESLLMPIVEAEVRAKEEGGRLAVEWEKKQNLRARMKFEGVSIHEIDAQIENLRAAVHACESALENAIATRKTVEAMKPRSSYHSVRDLRTELEKCGCKEALVVVKPDDEELFRTLPLSFPEIDEAGRPKQVCIELGGGQQHCVPLAMGRILVGEGPEPLAWVGCRPCTAQPRERRAFVAVHVESTGRNYLSQCQFQGPCRPNSGYGSVLYRSESSGLDFTHLATPLSDFIAQQLDGVLEVQAMGDYPVGSLAAFLRDRVLEVTRAESFYRPSSEQLKSEEIARRIAAHWTSFVGGPWHADIIGRLALLKYLVEQGERPRFWSGPFEGLYGFRVRTRDHDWIVGEMFLADARSAPGTRIVIEPSVSYSDTVARIGELWLRVGPAAK